MVVNTEAPEAPENMVKTDIETLKAPESMVKTDNEIKRKGTKNVSDNKLNKTILQPVNVDVSDTEPSSGTTGHGELNVGSDLPEVEVKYLHEIAGMKINEHDRINLKDSDNEAANKGNETDKNVVIGDRTDKKDKTVECSLLSAALTITSDTKGVLEADLKNYEV